MELWHDNDPIASLTLVSGTTDDQKDIPEIRNNYFCNVGTSIAQGLANYRDEHPYKLSILEICVNSLFLRPVEQEKMSHLIRKLDPNKGPGIDDKYLSSLLKIALIPSSHFWLKFLISRLKRVFIKIDLWATPIFKNGSK